jgi:hypothetical protein
MAECAPATLINGRTRKPIHSNPITTLDRVAIHLPRWDMPDSLLSAANQNINPRLTPLFGAKGLQQFRAQLLGAVVALGADAHRIVLDADF